MAGMTQKELSSLIFTVVLFEKENIRNRAKSLKKQLSKVIYLLWIDKLLLDFYNYDSFLFPFQK